MADLFSNRHLAAGRERVPQVSEAAAVTAYGVLSPAVLDVYAPADSRVPGSFWHRKLSKILETYQPICGPVFALLSNHICGMSR